MALEEPQLHSEHHAISLGRGCIYSIYLRVRANRAGVRVKMLLVADGDLRA